MTTGDPPSDNPFAQLPAQAAPTGPVRLDVGDIVGRYVITEPMSADARTKLYLVKHASLESAHVLKVVAVPSKSVRDELMREGRVQGKLRHKHLVPVTDVLAVGDSAALVFEYIDGPTLTEWNTGERTIQECLHVFQGIVLGVGAAHKAGLVHRNLNPDNVLIAISDGEIVPRVTGFALANTNDDTSGPGRTMGRPGYTAPEQLRDHRGVDHRADLFALGCILFELLCKAPAFPGKDAFEVHHAVMSGKHTDPRSLVPSLPSSLDALIAELLDPDPACRPRTCEGVLSMLQVSATPQRLAGPEASPGWEPRTDPVPEPEYRRASKSSLAPAESGLPQALTPNVILGVSAAVLFVALGLLWLL